MATEVAELVARLRADASGYVAGITQAVAANVKFSESQRAMVTSTSQTASQVGGTLSKYVSLPIAAVGAASIKMSMDYQKSFALMQGLAGVPAKEIDNLKKQVKGLAGDVGQSPQALAKALYFITSGGIDASKSMDVLRASAKAATAGLGSVDTVAYSAVSAINAFKDQNLTAAQATDVMVGTVKAATFESDQLAGAMGRVLPIADQAGLSFGETGAALAILSQGGLDANLSTTALLNVLQQTISPAQEATTAWNEMFHSVTGVAKAQSLLKDGGIVKFLQKIAEGTKGDAEKLSALFPDIRGEIGAASLTKAFENDPAKFKAIADSVQNSAGATDKAFKVMQDTLAGSFGQAVAKASAALINLGDQAAPAISALASAFNFLAEAATHIPKPVLDGALAVGALVAAAGPALLIFGALSRSLVSITDLLAKYTAQTVVATEAQEALAVSTTLGGAASTLGGGAEVAAATAPVTSALGAYGLEGLAATGAATGFTAALGPLAIAATGAAAAVGLLWVAHKTDTMDAGANAASVKDLTKEILAYNNAKGTDQDKMFAKVKTDITAATAAMKSFEEARQLSIQQAAAGHLTQAMDTAGGLGGPETYPKPQELNNVHTSLMAIIKDQGAMAAKPYFDRLIHEMGLIPGALAAVKPMFADVARAIQGEMNKAAASAAKFGATLGVNAGQTASAVQAYNDSIGTATKLTADAVEQGQQAAIMLSRIGVAAKYAGDATVEGMSAAEIAVRGLTAAMSDQLAFQQANDTLDASLTALQDAKNNVGGGGGGGGGGKTAIGAAIDHREKELALRDAMRGVKEAATAVQGAELSLTSARLAAKQATFDLHTEEQKYAETLHGVAINSREAKDAIAAYASAKLNARGAGLDINDARRSLAQAKNDRQLLALDVSDAKKKLAEDMKGGAGATTTWLQTPTGSIKQTTGGSGPADASQILRDKIALKDAEIALSGGADSVKRAELALNSAQLAGKTATRDLHKAHVDLRHTMDGYPPSSKEAQQATLDLNAAMLNQKEAAYGVITANQSLVQAQDNIATAAVGAQRASADLKGQLDTTGGAASTAAKHVQAVAAAEHQVAANMVAVAQAAASQVFNKDSQPIAWTQTFVDKLTALQGKLDPKGQLATFFAWWIQAFQHLADIKPLNDINNVVSGTGAHLPTAGNTTGGGGNKTVVPVGNAWHPKWKASGGPVIAGMDYIVGERGWETFRPSVNGQIIPHGGPAGGGGRSATTINLTVQSLDPATAGDVVIKALRDATKANGIITGVRTQ